MSKGSNRRPATVSRQEYEQAWERTFGGDDLDLSRMAEMTDDQWRRVAYVLELDKPFWDITQPVDLS